MNENRRPAGRKAPPRRADRFAQQEENEEVEGQLEGRNAISEALKSGRTIDKVFVADGDTDRALQRLAAQAKEAGAFLGAIAKSHQETKESLAFIAGGETVVRLTGHGKGGRNQELAL